MRGSCSHAVDLQTSVCVVCRSCTRLRVCVCVCADGAFLLLPLLPLPRLLPASCCSVLPSLASAVIAPYREPSMLHWLRRNPRLLLMSASTLAGNISGLLSVLTPGLMLPDAAAELLSKCPSLVARTPAGVQVCVRLLSMLGSALRCGAGWWLFSCVHAVNPTLALNRVQPTKCDATCLADYCLCVCGV